MVAARCSARLAPPLFRDGWEGDDEDSVRCGDVVFVKDGVDAPKDMGEGAINPTERPGGSPYSGGSAHAKGAGGAAHGVVLPCWWWGGTFPGDTGE